MQGGNPPVKSWPFQDAENVAVFSLARIFDGGAPILIVVHDDDGDWQFLDGSTVLPQEAFIVGLQEIVSHDPTLLQVACLPCGYKAWRHTAGGAWHVEEI